jgi:hypothetical protein
VVWVQQRASRTTTWLWSAPQTPSISTNFTVAVLAKWVLDGATTADHLCNITSHSLIML